MLSKPEVGMSFKFSRAPQKCNLQARKHGKATADPKELDVDAILAAQAPDAGVSAFLAVFLWSWGKAHGHAKYDRPWLHRMDTRMNIDDVDSKVSTRRYFGGRVGFRLT